MYLRRQRARANGAPSGQRWEETVPNRPLALREAGGGGSGAASNYETNELHFAASRRTNEGAFLKLLEIVADSDDLIKSHRAPVFTYILAERETLRWWRRCIDSALVPSPIPPCLMLPLSASFPLQGKRRHEALLPDRISAALQMRK